MPRGGSRPGAGRPKKTAGPVPKVKRETVLRPRKSLGGMTPLEYMMHVMNDDDADDARRDRMAVAAAPYVHARAEAAAPGKKEQRQAAAEEQGQTGGKYAPPAPPGLMN
jgi:hypothetical protein